MINGNIKWEFDGVITIRYISSEGNDIIFINKTNLLITVKHKNETISLYKLRELYVFWTDQILECLL